MRLVGLFAALAGLAAGVLLLLLAADVARIEQRVAADDARFRTRPADPLYWRLEERVPFELARRLLGVEDDLAHRRAVQAFWRSGPTALLEERERLIPQRTLAQQLLTEVEGRAPTPERRAELANLRGILALVATSEEGNRRTLVQAAADGFARAVRRDPRHEDAKFNLEVLLKNAENVTGSGTGGGGGGGRKGTQTGGAAASGAGSGY